MASDIVPHRALITGCTMAATLMQALDSTIANVALPYMQGSLSATSDQITWVLTSYVIAAAIMTAPVGWLSARFGRKNLFIVCLAGFTAASMLCGAAQSLEEMVLFRLLQGVFGAALVPLSQATMLDIYPVERRAQAMAIFGIGIMVGPIMGPALGGLLTESFNWRWVFYVNLPFGLLAIAGLLAFMPADRTDRDLRFDWTGFAVLALGIGAFQLMLDRGQNENWFASHEIIIEATLAVLGLYLFVVHMLTAETPFLPSSIFRDRNFVAAMLMMFAIGLVLLASSALLAPYLQNLADYPVEQAGLAMAPRGAGTMVAMVIAGRIGNRIDGRALIGGGLVMLSWSLYDMSLWTPDVSEHRLVATIVVQGFAMGIVFNPLSVQAFATLAPPLRGAGTALLSLFRNIGMAVGVSVTSFSLAQFVQASHADIAGYVTPFNRMLQAGDAASRFYDPLAGAGAGLLNSVINRQAEIIAYANDYRLMMVATLAPLLLLPLMRRAGRLIPPAAPSEAH
jgi:DHA2 family multidrug resistance protein